MALFMDEMERLGSKLGRTWGRLERNTARGLGQHRGREFNDLPGGLIRREAVGVDVGNQVALRVGVPGARAIGHVGRKAIQKS